MSSDAVNRALYVASRWARVQVVSPRAWAVLAAWVSAWYAFGFLGALALALLYAAGSPPGSGGRPRNHDSERLNVERASPRA